ncbi:AraC family transcriptional regulator [Opitutaceae bacterium TAV5]|nr:AraC family transcriptional regulator [Opitutaceae bacterium TAV5]
MPASVHATRPDPRAEFERDLSRTLERMHAGRLRVHVAPEIDLRRPRPGAHFHPTPEFFIQTGGGTDFVCPGGAFRVRTGDVCVMPRGVPHAETPRDLRTPYGILVCMHRSDGLYLHRGRADPARRIQGYGTTLVPGTRGRDALRYLDDIAARDNVPRSGQKRYTEALVEAFLLTVLGELQRPAQTAPAGSALVVETEKLAHTHLADPALSVAALAKGLGCTPDHLSRRFHRERGVTLNTWIRRERVRAAQELLADSRYNIAEVGWACGFATPSYFIRVFREHTGLTPRLFRAGQAR